MSLDPDQAADAMLAEVRALPAPNTPALRAVRRDRSRAWKHADADDLWAVAIALQRRHAHRWLGCELIRHHPAAFAATDDTRLERLAMGLDSWDSVDAFARILSGPAWLKGLASDALVDRWSASPDRWLRRAALVSTVALNAATDGGPGDPVRTLRVCDRLAGDRDDMVEKALSWALRELLARDPVAVQAFLAAHDARLAARVKREVRNKLTTGLKTPRAR